MPKTAKRRHDKTIKEMSEDHKSSLHRIDKKQVNMKAAEGSGEVGGSFVPSPEQLAKINEFTRVEATADNVVAFTTMSCNDLYDRDDEKFTADTIDAFAALPKPFSPVGKSYMADHEYKMGNVRGRIFDVGVERVSGTKFLTNDIYIPNTAQHKDFIENIDFGLNWAVSVGVVIDAANCSICKEPVYNSRFFGSWCAAGHEKGYFYVPGEEEDDGWGFFIPVDPSTKGAIKAQVDLSDPVDFYELSQVFLGAQYFAELAKKPGFKGMIKAASAGGVPIIGLSSEEAKVLPIRHEPQEVSEARQKCVVVQDEDGLIKWTDSTGLQWKYDADEGEVLCFGKEVDSDEEEDDTEEETETTTEEADEPEDSDDESDDDDAEEGVEEEDESDDDDDSDKTVTAADGGSTETGKEGEQMDKKAVLRAAKKAKLPMSIIETIGDAEGSGLEAVFGATASLIKSQEDQIEGLTPRAVLGDAYHEALKSDALHWYTVAHRDPKDPGKGINTARANKLIAAAGGDVDLIKEMTAEWKETAQRLFPPTVRRSAVPVDPNTPEQPGEIPFKEAANDDKTSRTVRRLHSR